MLNTLDIDMIYLDNAATSFPKPECVYEAMDRFGRSMLANPGRAGHKMAVGSERVLDDTRHALNQLFDGAGPERFIFTLNCTDALNLAIKGILEPGDHVVTTDLEHNSVSRPLQAMANSGRISLTRVASNPDGFVSATDIVAALTDQTRLVVMTHASNVIGTVQPVQEVGALLKDHRVVFLVDAAQTAGVVPISVRGMGIDLLAFPGHKSLLGPTGTGALYVAPHVQLRAWREGGTGGDSSSPVQPGEYPYFLEGGTPNVLGVAGLGEGVRYLLAQDINSIRSHELDLVEQLLDWVASAGAYRVLGNYQRDMYVSTVSLCLEELPATEIGAILDQSYDIAVRPGLHCAPYIHKAQGTFPDGTLRISPGAFSTENDIAQLCGALQEIAEEVSV